MKLYSGFRKGYLLKTLLALNVLISFLVLLCACSDEYMFPADAIRVKTDKKYEGMIKVSPIGEPFTLGSNDDDFSEKEKPEMEVLLDYDYMVGKHEVTRKEYFSLMGKKAGGKLHIPDDVNGDSLPITNVTYFDAVLFANARSKKEKYDTAYTYVSASFNSDGNCTNLEGLTFNPDVDAYRLPTEAEWTLVAYQNWTPLFSWNSKNSNYTLHSICTADINHFGFCDLSGNVLEWVNDWLGKFRDTSVVNYVGAPDGGRLGERVVKGGSYRDQELMSYIPRGDIYTVTSSSLGDYLGFRLAFGKIPNPVWMGSKGGATNSRIVIKATSSMVKEIFGSYQVKLAFRNDNTGNLAYVNYATGSLSIEEIEDTMDVYHPEISPDGKWVAFSTMPEGVDKPSTVYVRSLVHDSILVKLDAESAAIPRWRILQNGDTVIEYVSDAGVNSNEADWLSKSTWQVVFAKGLFKKPKKIMEGSFHGGISNDESLAVTGARLLRARMAAKKGRITSNDAFDSLWYNGEQACNVSLSKDGSKRTLFLDFAGKTGADFVGKKYVTHERLFVADSTGRLIQSVSAPSGYTFDHTEWVSRTNYAVATLTNKNGAHEKIVLVNMRDSSITELLEGGELWHPNVWVKESVEQDGDVLLYPDSAGVYYVEGGNWSTNVLRTKMELFWTHKDEIEFILVGSSRVESGIIPDSIKTGYALNMGHSGNCLNSSVYIANYYALNHAEKLKAIVIGIDIDIWYDKTGMSSYVFDAVPGYRYDEHHDFWKDGVPEGFIDAVQNSYPSTLDVQTNYMETRGFVYREASGWGDAEVEQNTTDTALYNGSSYMWNLEMLGVLLMAAYDVDVKVIGVIFPQNPKYRQTKSWGRYGPSWTLAEKIMERLEWFDFRYTNFYLLDENKMGMHDYTDDMAVDTDHLSGKGAAQLTHRLDSLLSTIRYLR